jgi:hypothetical protein
MKTVTLALIATSLMLGSPAARSSGLSLARAGGAPSSGLHLELSRTAALFAIRNMAPGDAVTEPLEVRNAGQTRLRYAITAPGESSGSGALKRRIALAIRTADATTPDTRCDDFDGDLLFWGDLTGAGGRLVGNPLMGAHPGDRTLAAFLGETLCFRVSLPLAAPSSLQGASTSATFTFHAEQVVHPE